MKKIISALIATSILLSTTVFSFGIESCNFTDSVSELITLTPNNGFKTEEEWAGETDNLSIVLLANENSTSEMSLDEFLRGQFLKQTETIYVSDYEIPSETFSDTIFSFIFRNADLPVCPRITDIRNITVDGISYIYSFKPVYLYPSIEEADSKRADLDELTTNLAEYASKGKTELEKALFLFDKISLDYFYTPGNTFENINYTPYSFLVNGHSVCQGYALLYKLALDKLGIESYLCSNPNKNINHAWNYLKIDNKWYHADSTWSYYSDAPGKISRKYFLLSDSAMLSDEKHGVKSDWKAYAEEVAPIDCTSDDFATGYLFNRFIGEPIYRDELSIYFNRSFTTSPTTSINLKLRNDTLKTPDALFSEPDTLNGETKIHLLTLKEINKKTNIVIAGYSKYGDFIGCEKLSADTLPANLMTAFPVPTLTSNPYMVKWMMLDSATLSPTAYFGQLLIK